MAQPKQLDKLLSIFYKEFKPYNIKEIDNILQADGEQIKKETLHVLIRKLIADKYLDRFGETLYQISFDGVQFHEYGGYKKEFFDKKFKEMAEHERDRLEKQQIKSIIATNKSVEATNEFAIANGWRQNRLTIASIIVAGASALFALGAMYATLKDTTSEELKSLRQQLQKQSQVQEQMQQSQKGIDSSMKVFLQRSDTVHH